MTGPVVLRDVSHTHGANTPWARPALQQIDLTIRTGERLLIAGGNGSGKSTLAWILAGLTKPTSGTATWAGVPLSDEMDRIGLLVQHTRLQLLRPTVAGEMGSFGMSPERILWAVSVMGFESNVLNRAIDELSVGQQRRVGLAVLIGRGSEFLVLDEPMAGLDRAARQRLTEAIDRLPITTTVVTVTHDLEDSRELGRRIVRLADGRIVEDRAA